MLRAVHLFIVFSLGLSFFVAAGAAAQSPLRPPEADALSTSGPTPPVAVSRRDALKPLETAQAPASAATLPVPAYLWRHGCGPTALGMIAGYYDGLGFDDLIPGSAASQTDAVNQAIASGGTLAQPKPAGAEQHLEDYGLPKDDTTPGILTDDYLTQGRSPHADNSIADFMLTSRSTESLKYGWSWASGIGPAWTGYAQLRNPAYQASSQRYYMFNGELTWSVLTAEIDAGRPMSFLVDTEGDGSTDHFVAVIGYRTSPTQQYAAWDTWSATTIRWEDFTEMAAGTPWGVFAGWSFQIGKPPAAFGKSSPANGASAVSTSPTLAWQASNGASGYAYCIDESNDNACASWTSTGSETSAILSGLSSGTTYSWQARASNNSGATYADGGSSAFWSFTTSGTPGAFDKIGPADGASAVSTRPTLSWQPSGGATGYEYCIDASPDNACEAWTSAGTATSVALAGLSLDTTYSWQARATGSHGTLYANGSSTAFWSFTTQVEPDQTVHLPAIHKNRFIASEQIIIPAGDFSMGCDPAHNGGFACSAAELPLHSVYLDAYAIDRTEVTNAQYARCVAGGACREPEFNYSSTRPDYFNDPAYARYPVIYVSWDDAQDYCAWVGMRLPTEAEWEKAARGASGPRAYPWGEDAPGCTLANAFDEMAKGNCLGDSAAVGSYADGASVYGVVDLAGNVWEWVNDWYADTYYSSSPASNPPGPASGSDRVLRGGGWDSAWDLLRTAGRVSDTPILRIDIAGFRCAATVEPNP